MAKPSVLSWAVANVTRDAADVDIFDVIGDPWGDGVSASDFVKTLRDLRNIDRINFHINSPGGYVSDALAMYNAILGHPADTWAYNIASAHSAASFLMQAADHRVIAQNASMFIHPANVLVIGDAVVLRAVADGLDADTLNIASIYAERAGGDAADWLARMTADNGAERGSTYRGQDAVDVGLADEVGIPQTVADQYMRRVAALMRRPTNTGDPGALSASLREALSAAKREPVKPSLEQLLEVNPFKNAFTAAFGKGA